MQLFHIIMSLLLFVVLQMNFSHAWVAAAGRVGIGIIESPLGKKAIDAISRSNPGSPSMLTLAGEGYKKFEGGIKSFAENRAKVEADRYLSNANTQIGQSYLNKADSQIQSLARSIG